MEHRRQAARRGRQAGFSLLELLIALTILAIALIPVAYFYTRSLQMVEEAGIRTRALMLAQERITELEQIPYDQLLSNVTPSKLQLVTHGLDSTTTDWYGYDFETNGQWRAMFRYALPLDFNPYDPDTQGYNNNPNVNRLSPNNPLTGDTPASPPGQISDTHVNFNNGAATLNYEYEPIGFYRSRVFSRNSAEVGAARADINFADRRTLSNVEPTLASGLDRFRSGYDTQLDNYAIFGRRTIIMDVIPRPQDSDGAGNPASRETGTDNRLPDDDRDGGATVFDPYPITKGPDNKFQVLSKYGTRGKLVIVQVFWLPRQAPETYIPARDLNKIELKSFIPEDSTAGGSSVLRGTARRTDYLDITPVP